MKVVQYILKISFSKQSQLLVLSLICSVQLFAQFSITADIHNVTCAGFTNGQIIATATGGQFPYTYSWSNGAVTSGVYGVLAGVYSVTATDGLGETAVGTYQVTQPAPININFVSSGATCGTGTTTITANVVGGVAPYQYNWSNGVTTSMNMGMAPSYYNVTVTDANGCRRVSGLTIAPALSANITTVQPSCTGTSPGRLTASASGGTAPFAYVWSNGSTTNFIQPAAGTYQVTITDSNGCTATSSATLNSGVLDFTISVDTPCSASNNASVNILSGTAPYTYQWSTGATSASVSNLPQTSHFVTVTDANGCKKSGSISISHGIDAFPKFYTHPACNGLNTGRIVIGVDPPGLGPHTFQWSNGSDSVQATNLPPGLYGVTVTDAVGCTDTVRLQLDPAIVLNASITATIAGCNGATTGSASVALAGGTAPYTYAWNDSNQQTSATATQIAAGNYMVTITDAQGCLEVASVNVPEASGFNMITSSQNLDCPDQTSGAAMVVQANTQYPPVTYLWNNGAVTSGINGLGLGTYTVTVTDALLCTSTQVFNITAAHSIVSEFSYDIIACEGDSVLVNFQNTSQSNDPILSTQWLIDGQTYTTSNPSVWLTAFANYQVNLMVSNGICDDEDIQMVMPVSLNVNLPTMLDACLNDTLQVNGTGDAGLSYTWSPSNFILSGGNGSTPMINTSMGGNFMLNVLVSNNAGCDKMFEIPLSVIDASTFTPDSSLISIAQCNGLTLTFVNNNDFAGSYVWNFGDPNTPMTATGAQVSHTYSAPGIYTVSLMGNTECLPDYSFEVVVTEAPILAFTVDAGPCSSEVQIDFMDVSVVNGGILSYQWTFSNGDTSSIADPSIIVTQSGNLQAVLVVTYGNGCTQTLIQDIPVNTFIPPVLPDTIVVCNGMMAELNPNGNPNFIYTWGNGIDVVVNPTVSVNSTTPYPVTISQGACSAADTVIAFVPPVMNVMLQDTAVTCEISSVTLTGNASTATNYLWSDSPTFNPVLSTTSSVNVQSGAPQWYFLQATDIYGCNAVDSVLVFNAPIDYVLEGNQNICAGTNPSISFGNNTSGFPFVVTWAPTDPNDNALNENGVFVASFSNAFGCTAYDTVAITAIQPGLGLSATASPDTIFQSEESQLEVLTLPGNMVQWSAGNGLDPENISNPIVTPEESTMYTVTVTDGNGCTASTQVNVLVIQTVCAEPIIYFPTAFTPNDDGLNDVLKVEGLNMEEVFFIIYNRWGEKMFEGNTVDAAWDGTFKGEKLAPDVYGYLVRVKCTNGETFTKKGNVSILY